MLPPILLVLLSVAGQILLPQWASIQESLELHRQLSVVLDPQNTIDEQVAIQRARTSLLTGQAAGKLSAVPAAMELSSIYRDLESIAAAHDISLQAITPKDARTFRAYRQLAFEVSVTATYPDLIRFMHHLEALNRQFRIRQILVQDISGRGRVQATLIITGMLRI